MASKLQRVKTLAADFVEEAPQVVTQKKRTGKPIMVNKVIQITQEQHQFLKRLKAETAIPGNVFFRQLLNEYIEKEKLNEIADYYIKELYNQKYARTLYYSSYEIHPLDENNGKWIIFFIYVTKEHQGDKNYWDEVVFMLPDGTIVISENNFEEIKFE